jgi:hypothetical protein
MLHACVERFDVMGGRGNILGWDEGVNKALDSLHDYICTIITVCASWFADVDGFYC